MVNNAFILTWIFRTSLALPLVKWTLHSVQRNWNDAGATCRSKGGNLATPMTTLDRDVFKTFMGRPPWKSYIGLSVFIHAADNKAVQKVEWETCTDPFTVWTDTQFYMDEACGTVSLFKSIATCDCYKDHRAFVCQRIEDDKCNYTQVSAKVPVISGTPISQGTPTGCQAICDASNDCWAYSFEYATDDCLIYETTETLYFEGGNNLQVSSSNIDTFYKTCFLQDFSPYSYNLTISPSIDPIDFQCGTVQSGSTVYTIYDTHLTWNEAVQFCDALGQEIAIIDNMETFYVLRTMAGSASLGFHWLGFREINERVYWMNNELVQNYTGEDPALSYPTCGAKHMDTGLKQLHDCTTTMPFICQEIRGSCGFYITSGLTGVNFQTHASMSTEACRQLCTIMTDCFVFVHSFKIWPSSYKTCYTMTGNDWKEVFHPDFQTNFQTDNDRFITRWTCVWLVMNNIVYEATFITGTASVLEASEIVETTELLFPSVPASEEVIVSSSEGSVNVNPSSVAESVGDTSAAGVSLSSSSSVSENEPSTVITPPLTESQDPIMPSTTVSSPEMTSLPLIVSDSVVPTDSSAMATGTAVVVTSETNLVATPSLIPATGTASLNNATIAVTTATPKPKSGAGGSGAGESNLCACACPANLTIPGESAKKKYVDLLIPEEATSAYKRRKESAEDHRPSAQGIGTVACFILSSVFLLILVSDALTFWA